MTTGTAERAAGDADDYGRIGAQMAEDYANSPPDPRAKGLVAGPHGLVDPGAAEVSIVDVSRAREQVGFTAVAGTKRAGIRFDTGRIALVYPEPAPDGMGGYTLSAGTPNLSLSQSGASGPSGQLPVARPWVL